MNQEDLNPPKVVLIPGAIKGLGKAIGIDLARQGYAVAATYHDWIEELPCMQRELAAAGSDPLVLKADLRDPVQVGRVVQAVIARFGRLDILINNIERGGWPIVHGEYCEEQWDLEMETTLKAKRWLFHEAFPYLKQSRNGLVINLSSIAAIVGRSGPASLVFNEGYAAANRGIALLTENWARMGAPNVRVNEIMLGLFTTRHGDQTRGWGLLSAAEQQALVDHTLLKRLGTIEDLLKAVRFIINDAPFMTGTVLRLDGGYPLGSGKVGEMPKGCVAPDPSIYKIQREQSP